MQAKTQEPSIDFLAGGGEMGRLMREKDWSKTLVGSPAYWPQSLRTTLSILLNSKFPMFLFWGQDLIQFYNDAYRPSLGSEGKHPKALGQKGVECWPEIWDDIKPMIDQVMSGNGSVWKEDQLLPIFRNGELQDVYWTFSYSPVKDESGTVNAVLVVCSETTKQVSKMQEISISEELLKFTIDAAGLGTWDLNPYTSKFIGNDRLKEWFGLNPEEEIGLDKAINAIAAYDRKHVTDSIKAALDGVSGGNYEIEYDIISAQTNIQRTVLAKGKVKFLDNGTTDRFSGILEDITARKTAELLVRKSEEKFRDTVAQAPVGIVILRKNNRVIELANDTFLKLTGRTADILNKELFDVLPEVKAVVKPLIEETFRTGTAYEANELEIMLKRNGKTERTFFNFVYQPLRGTDEAIDSLMVIATEVTEQVKTKLAVTESERRFRHLIDQSPIGMAIFMGATLVVDLANETLLKTIWQRSLEDVQNKKLLDIFPELAGQKYPALLQQVFETGITYKENEAETIIDGPDGRRRFYFDYNYAPLFDTDAKVSGIVATIIDVTEKVEARHLVNESAERLLLATEGTQQSTWDLNLQTGEFIHSPRLAIIFGFDPSHKLMHIDTRNRLHAEDREKIVAKAFSKALETGIYFYEARILQDDGSLKWIRTNGKVIFDEQKNPLRMLGTLVDITEQKENELFLAEHKEKLEIVINASELGTWELDLADHKIICSPRYLEILGLDPTGTFSHAYLLKRLHPDDLHLRKAAYRIAYSTGKLHFVTRLITEDGSLKWVETKGKVFYDDKDKPQKMVGTLRDLTEERKYQQRIQESEQRFRSVADTAPVLIWMAGPDKLCTFFNKAWLKFTGRTVIQEQGNGWVEGIYPDDFERCLQTYHLSFDARKEFYMEYRLRRHDGEYRWMSDSGVPRFTKDGVFEGYIGASMDINDRIVFEQKITESENRLRIAALSGELGTWDYNPETGTMIWDNASRELYGIPPDQQVTIETFFQMAHPEDIAPAGFKMQRALNPDIRETYDAEYRLTRFEDGRQRWIHAKGKALFNDHNKPVRFSGTLLDITEKKLALEELQENEQRYRFLANAMPQFVWTGNSEGGLNYFNDAMYEFAGYLPGDFENAGWIRIVHPDERRENVKKWMHSIDTGEPFLFEHRFRRHDGVYRWQLSRAVPQKDEQGNIQMWVGTSTDIDEIKKLEEQKNDFIKIANHELKTPVTTIKGYVQLLLKTHANSGDAVLLNALGTVDKQVTKLTNLVSDLLDVTKIERGSLPLNMEVFHIADLVRDSVKDMAAASGVHELILTEKNNPLVLADKDRISQVLINLFTNASKYSPAADKVLVSIDTADDKVIIAVQDFGIGIAKEDQEKIFERFYRVSGKDEKTFPGFGIGLFIVKEIVTLHKGNIWLESEKDRGATFFISLPIYNKQASS